MELNRKEQEEIVSKTVDRLCTKLLNEVANELMEHPNFIETDDAFERRFNNVTLEVVKEMSSQILGNY